MKTTIEEYFHKEMQLLNESLHRFAQQYPQQAANLTLDSSNQRDPNIERLLEGCAYLQARTKQQIDLGVHHLSESLIRQLAPQYLQPRPAKTMVEFTSPQLRLVQSETLPSGVKFASPPIGEEQTVCEFVTAEALTIHPLTIASIDHSAKLKGLYLTFKLNEGVCPSTLKIETLSLFIHAPFHIAAAWHHCLTQTIERISMRYPNGSSLYLGGQERIKNHIKGGGPDRLGFDGLAEYFQFPEQFCRVDIDLKDQLFKENEFTLYLEYSDPAFELKSHAQLFKLHCVPAVNWFITQSEPIRYRHSRKHYPFAVLNDKKDSVRLHSIKRLAGIDKLNAQAYVVHDFHQEQDANPHRGYYRLSQSQEKEECINHYLTFSGTMPNEMHLSAEVAASNGHYPAQHLSAQTLFLKDNRVCAQITATNISKPCLYHQPAFTRQRALNIMTLLHGGIHQLADIAFIKKIMHLHGCSSASHRFIEQGIKTVSLNSLNCMRKGMFVSGITYQLEVLDEAVSSAAEWSVFGAVLHQALKELVPINAVLETVIKRWPSKECFLHWGHDELN